MTGNKHRTRATYFLNPGLNWWMHTFLLQFFPIYGLAEQVHFYGTCITISYKTLSRILGQELRAKKYN
jgi:hypothetical protein